MADELDLESLFSAVGLEPILAGDPTLHKYQVHRAAELPRELRRRILRFMASDAFQPAKDVAPFDYDATLKTVSAGELAPAAAAALVAAVPDHDLARDLAGFANKILSWANPIMPREAEQALIGVRQVQPDGGSVADFRRVWQVAADPMAVLDDLEDGSLSDDQVQALALLYPAIYGELKQAIVDEDAVMQSRRKAWEPSPQKAALLRLLRGEQPSDPELTAAVQAVYGKEAQQAPAPPPRRSGGARGATAPDALTPGQKASTGASNAG
jgi:hypothetical protein